MDGELQAWHTFETTATPVQGLHRLQAGLIDRWKGKSATVACPPIVHYVFLAGKIEQNPEGDRGLTCVLQGGVCSGAGSSLGEVNCCEASSGPRWGLSAGIVCRTPGFS